MTYQYRVMAASAQGFIFRGQHFQNKKDLAEAILGEVAYYKELSKSQITSPSRKGIFVICRRVISYILHEKVGMSYERIGQVLGDRDHATTRNACVFLKDRLDFMDQFPVDKDLLEYLNSKLQIQ